MRTIEAQRRHTLRTIRRNPLGIRKLDVQLQRRQSYKDAHAHAIRRWSQETLPEDMIRLLENAYSCGWEQGVTVGAKATRDRVAEALEKGTLVKPLQCNHTLPGMNSTLEFQGHIAAPGYGMSYKCTECDKPFLRVGREIYDYEDIDPSDFEMTPDDVR